MRIDTEIIVGGVHILLMCILIGMHIWSIYIKKYKEATPQTLPQIVKYSIFFLIVGLFACTCLVLVLRGHVDLDALDAIANHGLRYLICVALILVVEQFIEKGNKEIAT